MTVIYLQVDYPLDEHRYATVEMNMNPSLNRAAQNW